MRDYLESLETVAYGKFNFLVGYPSTQEIPAGSHFFQMVEVEEANSIIYCGFQTTAYDIQFGFSRVTAQSTAVTGEGSDDVKHMFMEEIYPLQKVESSGGNMVKVSFIAKEAGVYKVQWSNSHSWFKAKTL